VRVKGEALCAHYRLPIISNTACISFHSVP
jgi:hypothetical protein